MNKYCIKWISGFLAPVMMLLGMSGCSSTVVGEYDYNDYHYKAPKRTFVTSNAKITERVSGDNATYTLSGDFFLPMPDPSDKKVIKTESKGFNKDYSVIRDAGETILLPVSVLAVCAGLYAEEYDHLDNTAKWCGACFVPGMSLEGDHYKHYEWMFESGTHTETVPKTGSNPLPVRKPVKKEDIGFRLLDERGRLHKQSDGSSSLDLALKELARKTLKNGGNTFKVVARIGKPGDSILDGQTEFIFKHRALDYSPSYSTLTDRITADCKVDVYRGSSRESLSREGTTPWKKAQSGYGNRLPRCYTQLKGKDYSSPVIEQSSTATDRSIHFVTKKTETLFSCRVKNAQFKHGGTAEKMKVDGGFPRRLGEQTLIPSTWSYRPESNEHWVQAIADGYRSQPIKIDIAKTKQVEFVEQNLSVTFSCGVKNALFKHGPTLEKMKIDGEFPVVMTQKHLVLSTGRQSLGESEYWVQVLAEGYYSEPLKIDFSKTKQVNFIEKTIKETVTSSPKGAEVLIGARPNLLNAISKDSLFGSKTETTPYQGLAKALVAQHDGRQQQVRFPLKYVSLRKDGYQETIGTLPRSTGDRSIHFVTREITEEVRSVPSGADVLMGSSKIDLITVGMTPYESNLKALVPEDDFGFQFPRKLLTVSKPGYARAYKEWPESSKNRSFNCELQAVPSGYLTLRADGDEVRVYVDDEFYDEIKSANKALSILVPTGEHTVYAEKNFYRTASEKVHLSHAGQVVEVEFKLKNASIQKAGVITSTLQQGSGTLSIGIPRNNDGEYTAIINEREYPLPLYRPGFPAGEYTIQVKGPQGFQRSITRTVEDGKECIIFSEDYGLE